MASVPQELRAASGGARRLAALAFATFVLAALAAVSIPTFAERPKILLGLMAAAALLPVAIRRPTFVAGGVVALTASYGTLAAYGLGAADLVDLLLIVLWASAIVTILTVDREAVIVWPAALLLVGYLAASSVQVLTAATPSLALRGLHTAPWFLATLIIAAYAPWPPGTRKKLGQVIVAVAGVAGLYAMLRLAVGPTSKELTAVLTRPNFGTIKQLDPALFGSFPTQKELAGWCTVVLPLCVATALFTTGGRRWSAAAVAGLLLTAIVASETRTALIACVIATAGVFAIYALAKSAVARTPVLIAAVLMIGVATTTAVLVGSGGSGADRERLAEVLDPTSAATLKERQQRWSDTFAQLGDRPLGAGLGTTGGVALFQGEDLDAFSRSSVDSSYVQSLLGAGRRRLPGRRCAAADAFPTRVGRDTDDRARIRPAGRRGQRHASGDDDPDVRRGLRVEPLGRLGLADRRTRRRLVLRAAPWPSAGSGASTGWAFRHPRIRGSYPGTVPGRVTVPRRLPCGK